jgi:hypothetical protein
MAYAADNDGLSADSILTFEDLEVWKHSDYIQDLLKKRAPDQAGIEALLEALKKQIPTIVLYSEVSVFRSMLQHPHQSQQGHETVCDIVPRRSER